MGNYAVRCTELRACCEGGTERHFACARIAATKKRSVGNTEIWSSGDRVNRTANTTSASDALLGARLRGQDFFGFECVFFADKYLESAAGPGNVRTHASGCVGLDDCVDLCSFECAEGHVGFELIREGVDYDEIVIAHMSIFYASEASPVSPCRTRRKQANKDHEGNRRHQALRLVVGKHVRDKGCETCGHDK